MHIPTGMMNGAVCPVTAAAAAAGIAMAAAAAVQSERKPTALRFASVSGFVFAAQMINFPVLGGTSGHLLGGVLASVLLGTPFGVLAMALVVSIQCLIFSDGGLSVLGANIVNMALIGAGLGGWLAGRLAAGRAGRSAGIGLAAWASVVLAAAACSLELAFAGVVPFSLSSPSILGIHALIGLGEALLTVLVVAVVPSVSPAGLRRYDLVMAAVIIALVLSPFASPLPDGLEWAAGRLGILHDQVPAFLAPLSGYLVPGLSGEALSTGLAGLAGIAAVSLAALCASLLWSRRLAR